jgi:hypothetical protein
MKQAEAITERKGDSMAEDEHSWIMWGAVISAVIGLYGLFVKHVFGHCSKDELDRLRDAAQYKGNCLEITKRLDNTQADMNKKLDQLLEFHIKEKDNEV